MEWLSLVPLILASLVVVFVPGALVLAPLGLRPFSWFATAAPASVAVIVLTGILVEPFGLAWNVLPVLGTTVVLTLLTWLLARLLGGRQRIRASRLGGATRLPNRPLERRRGWWTLASLIAGALANAWLTIRIIGRPDAFSQTFDNIFHLNAIRWIFETGNASSIQFLMTAAPDATISYYPLGWQTTAALALSVAGESDPVLATNALVLVIGPLVWTAGCLLLTRAILPANALSLLTTAALSVAFGAHPFLLLGFGVLYPNWLALCLAPTALAWIVHVLRLAPGQRITTWRALIALAFAGVGVAAAHPNIAMMLLALGVTLLAAWGVREWNWPGEQRELGANSRRALLRTGLLLVTVLVAGYAWNRIRPEWGQWMPTRTFPEALGEALLVAPVDMPTNLLVAPLVLAGCYIALRTRTNRWLLLAHLVLVYLWLMAAAGPVGLIRNLSVGIWYNDPYRLAAQLPLTAIPLAVMGVHAYGGVVSDWLARRVGGWVQPALAVLVAVMIGASATIGPLANRLVTDLAPNYWLTPNAPLVNTDEYELIMRIPDEVSPEGVIATTPWNGASMVYAFTGIPTTVKHVFYEETPELRILNQSLDELATDPRVCPVVQELNVRYVLDFSFVEVHGHRHPHPGFEQLLRAEGFELLDQEGRARLFRITGC